MAARTSGSLSHTTCVSPVSSGSDLVEEDLNDDSAKTSNRLPSPGATNLSRLPPGKIRTIMRIDPDVQLTSQEAAFLMTKSTEMFIEYLTMLSYDAMVAVGKKILSVADVKQAVDGPDNLVFLEGVLDLEPIDILNPNHQAKVKEETS